MSTENPTKSLRSCCEWDMEVDRISDLPSNLIDEILSRLSIRDAAKTSVLSSKWRYKWTMVPSLVLNDQYFPVSTDREGRTMTNKLVSDIDRILLLHSGPLQKFELSYYQFLPESDVDKWILHLPGHSIKEFTLNVMGHERYKVPSCVFSWQSLTCLKLECIECSLRPPMTFKGLKNLKSLYLRSVKLAQDAFDNLISGCPLLQRLTLCGTEGVKQVNIHAPNLEYCILGGWFVNLSLKGTSRLSVFSMIGLFRCTRTGNLIKFMADIPRIERLNLGAPFLEYLAGSDIIPGELPVPCFNLSHLHLDINFNSLKESLVLLCLLRSAPNLQELHTESSWVEYWETSGSVGEVSNVWEADHWNCPFTRLRRVITNCSGATQEINFIKFILLTSPVLASMIVVFCGNLGWDSDSDERKLEIVKQLCFFKRASTQAQIIVT